MRTHGLRFAMAVVLLFIATHAKADLVTNGGFETGSFSGWTVASTSCTGVGSNIGTGNPGCLNAILSDPGPHSGSYAAYLGSGSPDTLTQNLNTVAGASYNVSFWLASTECNGNQGCGGLGNTAPNSFAVSFGGNTLYSQADLPAFGYQEFTFTNVLATGPTTALTFTFSNVPVDFILDDVSVQAVPEPSSMMLLGTGAVSLLGAVRRKIRL